MSIDDIASPDPEPAVADHLGRIGAEQLVQRIRAYWSGLGHDQVRVWVERAEPQRLVGPKQPRRRPAASVVVIGDLDQHAGMVGHVERASAARVAAAEPRALTSSDLGGNLPFRLCPANDWIGW